MDRRTMPLYKRAESDFWWVRIGRKTRKSTGTTDRKQAEEFERVLTERLWRINRLGDRSAVSWNEAAERWLRDSRRERKRDRWFLAWLKPTIGAYPVSAVADPDVLEELRKDGLATGWSHSTVDRCMRTIRAVLRKCVSWRYLESAPAISMYGEAEVEPRFLTPEQFKKLAKELPRHLELAAWFAVLTLLRMRAQSGLTWDRIDLKTQRAWVPRGQMKAGKTFGFPLSDEAVKVLKACRTLSPKGSHVFQFDGRPIDNFNTAAFRKAAKRAGIEGLRWHDLRHTGASWAVQGGVTLQELMVLGDWKSYSMVLRYAHLAPSNAASAAQKVAQSVAQAKKRRAAPKRKRA
jgi:integrase